MIKEGLIFWLKQFIFVVALIVLHAFIEDSTKVVENVNPILALIGLILFPLGLVADWLVLLSTKFENIKISSKKSKGGAYYILFANLFGLAFIMVYFSDIAMIIFGKEGFFKSTFGKITTSGIIIYSIISSFIQMYYLTKIMESGYSIKLSPLINKISSWVLQIQGYFILYFVLFNVLFENVVRASPTDEIIVYAIMAFILTSVSSKQFYVHLLTKMKTTTDYGFIFLIMGGSMIIYMIPFFIA